MSTKAGRRVKGQVRPTKAYAAWIKVKRAELGMTQEELAERLGVHASIINLWENCRRPVSHLRVRLLAKTLNLRIDLLDYYSEFWPDERALTAALGAMRTWNKNWRPRLKLDERWKEAEFVPLTDEPTAEPQPSSRYTRAAERIATRYVASLAPAEIKAPTQWKFSAKCTMCSREAEFDATNGSNRPRCATCGGTMIYDGKDHY